MFALLTLACVQETVEFAFEPAVLDFGRVNFPPEMPDDGYAQLQLTVTNTGETDGHLTLPEPDAEIFCIEGFTTQEFPADVGEVNPGSAYVFTVGLCGYPPGTADSLVETALEITTDGLPETLTAPVTFTPNRMTE